MLNYQRNLAQGQKEQFVFDCWDLADYNKLQLQFTMAKNSKNKPNFQLILQASIVFNFVSLIVIVLMAYKYYRQIKKSKNLQNQNTSAQPNQTLNKTSNKSTQSATQEQQEQNEFKKVEKPFQNTSKLQTQPNIVTLQLQVSLKDKEIAKRIEIQQELKYELQLQQERGRFLQQKIKKLELKLKQHQTKLPSFAQKPTHQTTSQTAALSDLRNQLQFCQKRLLVSQNSEKELRLKLEEYQKLGQYSLDHPQYIRLRQMNTRYKQIIANLQTYLLQKNQAHPNFNISFNDL